MASNEACTDETCASGTPQSCKIIRSIVFPDQAEGTVGPSVLTHGRATLMVVENTCGGIIPPADVVDDAIGGRCGPFDISAANDPGLREQPGQDDARKQLIGVEAAGMRNQV